MRRALSALFGAAAALASAGAAVAAQPTPPPRLDLSVAGGARAAFLSSFSLAALHASTAPDEIPAIDEPVFDTPAQAGRLLDPSALVLGFARRGEAHAYPVDLLSLHEVVNDVVGGLPVAITWCPLCQSGAAFDRRVVGHTLRFGVSGYLFASNQVLFDR